jgi:hypothetical protein
MRPDLQTLHTTHTWSQSNASGLDDVEVCIEVEDVLGELSASPNNATDLDAPQHQVVDSQVLINGKLKSKACTVADFTKYGMHSGSTDQLHHI